MGFGRRDQDELQWIEVNETIFNQIDSVVKLLKSKGYVVSYADVTCHLLLPHAIMYDLRDNPSLYAETIECETQHPFLTKPGDRYRCGYVCYPILNVILSNKSGDVTFKSFQHLHCVSSAIIVETELCRILERKLKEKTAC